MRKWRRGGNHEKKKKGAADGSTLMKFFHPRSSFLCSGAEEQKRIIAVQESLVASFVGHKKSNFRLRLCPSASDTRRPRDDECEQIAEQFLKKSRPTGERNAAAAGKPHATLRIDCPRALALGGAIKRP